MVLPVYLYGHPVLRKETEDIGKDYPGLDKLIRDMWETMYFTEGVGLAAPQIGKSISLIVIDGSVLGDEFPECKDSKMCLINPELEVIEDVKRTEHVRLNWLDENFVEHEKEFTGFLSRIIQHEFDHLLGTVYTDRISPIRKQMVRNKLNNLSRGKVKCDYRTVSAKTR